jgi:RNA polymerase sigma factor (sigma-70 family)
MEQEFFDMWHKGIFVLDANVLLNIYRYSAKTREELLDIFSTISSQLWLPYQAAKEYHANRIGVITEQIQAYGQPEKLLNETYSKLKAMFQSRKHPFIENSEAVLNELSESFKGIKARMNTSCEMEMNFVKDNFECDEVKDRITKLFSERVGSPYDYKKLEILNKEAEERFDKKTPPGYEDKKKDGDGKFGDYILWSQIIDYAKELNKPILFITSDRKKDWWLINEGQTIGPRPELINEIWDKGGTSFYMYNIEQFMEYSRIYLKTEVKQDAIDEIKAMDRNEISQEEINHLLFNTIMSSEDFIVFKAELDSQLDKLTDREEKVLRLRFGLDDGRPRSRQEVGMEFGVTSSTISRIEKSAIAKLRNWNASNLHSDDHEKPMRKLFEIRNNKLD